MNFLEHGSWRALCALSLCLVLLISSILTSPVDYLHNRPAEGALSKAVAVPLAPQNSIASVPPMDKPHGSAATPRAVARSRHSRQRPRGKLGRTRRKRRRHILKSPFCKLQQRMVAVRDLGLGYDSDEVIDFGFCSGTCEDRRITYDIVISHLAKNDAAGISRARESNPCCRPKSFVNSAFLDNNNDYHSIQTVGMESILPGQGPTTLNNGIDAAALEVDRRIQDDRQYPEIAQMLGISADVLPGVSGMSDIDYPLLGTGQVSLPRLLEIGPVRRVPLPPELVEQFGHMQCNCMLGIFPDISRAWLTIDTDIYIWNYNDGGDLTYFDGLSETILSVGLVKPKPGVFQAHITHLLVLTTPVDIVILGVTFSALHTGASAPGSCVTEALSLLPEPLFCLPTDNTFFQVVEGTGTGRLFLAGQDGCLYEVAYQAEAGWFGQCCRKINHSRSSLSLFIPAVLQFSFSEEVYRIDIQHK
uniref:nuclear pore complex protein Nup155-like n=1 Tax=Myxine glutinosa TaxID=7769 RepID=UPI00358FCAB3